MLLAPALLMHAGKKHHENLKSRWQLLTSEVIATPPVSGRPHATNTRLGKKPVVWPVRSTGLFGMLSLERDSEGRLAFQRTDLQNRETNDLPGFVDFFHHSIVIRLPEIAFLMGE
jgi:hypothetical protein